MSKTSLSDTSSGLAASPATPASGDDGADGTITAAPLRDARPAVAALDAARVALLDWQAQAQQQLAETQTRLAQTQTHLAQTETQLEQSQSEARAAGLALDALRVEFAGLTEERNKIAGERDRVASERDRVAQERDEVAKDRDRWCEECNKSLEEGRRLAAQLAEQSKRNENLNSELMELYRDLKAEDLPTLILRIGMKLTGAENGLYVDDSGGVTLAAIGLDALPETVTNALYEFTREAANAEEPVVRNDSENLPDGSNLVNLAALPVAYHGDLRGVLLVANKREGPFTEDDTELLLSIGDHAGVALENHRLHCELAESYLSTIAVLADAIEAKDPYTRGHCESVAAVAMDVAQRLGWEAKALDNIRYAALLHDIGKIGIPDGILLKPGRLLPEEYQVIQRHAAIGSDLVKRVPSLEPIASIILHHHERVDGSGYPDGQSGEEIDLASRIIGVVDAFDAMTTPRPYRDPVSPTEALEELRRCAGSQFDLVVVDTVAVVLADRGQV